MTGRMSPADRAALGNCIRNGVNALLLGEKAWPEIGLPVRPLLVDGKANHAWIRSAGHPALDGIGDADLGFWEADHWVNQRVFGKPVRNGAGWRTLVDVGSREGLDGAVLAEVFEGRGRCVLNQLDLEKARKSPGARALLASLLRDLPSPAAPHTTASVMLRKDSALAGQIESLNVATRPWSAEDASAPLLISAGEETVPPVEIAAWVRRGGRALLVDLSPKNAARWSPVIRGGLNLEPIDPYDGALIVRPDPLLWGVSNEELFWCEGVWIDKEISPNKPRGNPMSRMATIAGHAIRAGGDAQPLLAPAVLTRVRDGRGEWLLTTIDFDAGWQKVRKKTARLTQALFTNLRVTVKESAQELVGDFQSIDLRAFANRGFLDDQVADGKGGWTDEGFDFDLHLFPDNISGIDLAGLPMPASSPDQWPSPLNLAGIPFDIIDPRANEGRTCVMLEPDYETTQDATPGDYLKEVRNIPVGRAFDRLYSLHASAFINRAAQGQVMWTYVLHYSDGSTAETPIRMGIETSDWRRPMELHDATVGWVGQAVKIKPIGLYAAELRNPNPAVEVRTIDIISVIPPGVSGIIVLTTGL